MSLTVRVHCAACGSIYQRALEARLSNQNAADFVAELPSRCDI